MSAPILINTSPDALDIADFLSDVCLRRLSVFSRRDWHPLKGIEQPHRPIEPGSSGKASQKRGRPAIADSALDNIARDVFLSRRAWQARRDYGGVQGLPTCLEQPAW